MLRDISSRSTASIKSKIEHDIFIECYISTLNKNDADEAQRDMLIVSVGPIVDLIWESMDESLRTNDKSCVLVTNYDYILLANMFYVTL